MTIGSCIGLALLKTFEFRVYGKVTPLVMPGADSLTQQAAGRFVRIPSKQAAYCSALKVKSFEPVSKS